ncbi:MAG TPA: LCCL domain-containing protein [Planctomycetaceae bacterium]|nr:LCCL domain-containing protein [Planctomycetaceae bacterium]
MSPRTARHGKPFGWLALAALCIGLGIWLPARAQFEREEFGVKTLKQPPIVRRGMVQAQDEDSNPTAPADTPMDLKPGEIAMLANFRDGGSLRMKLRAKTIPIVTAYGKLEIPAEDVQAIEFAPRVSEEDAKKVKEAIGRLSSAKPEDRNAAAPELFNLKEKAFIALVRASRSKDKDLAKRANELVDDLRELVPPALLEAPVQDTLETEDSRFAGDIPLTSVEATSLQFGNVELKLADLKSVSIESNSRVTEIRNINGNLTQFEGQIGRVIRLRVTGASGGPVWGTGTYTTQSSLASAAVHAGVLREGQTGIVRVRIKPPQQMFNQSFQNGVGSQRFFGQHAAFTFVR